MAKQTTLAEFLRSLRVQAAPQSLGIVPHGGRRRVPGLRREELAQIAGLSVSYYTSLEQGRSTHASEGVLRAIARSLCLDEFQEAHLINLGDGHRRRTTRKRRRSDRPDPQVVGLLDAMSDVPAFVHGPELDILAWNKLGHALYGPHLDGHSVEVPAARPNIARMVFLDPWCREIYLDWAAKAEGLVGLLRHNAGQDPDNAALSDLIGELALRSTDFSALWARHIVRPCSRLTVPLHHPHVGELTVTQQALTVVAAPQQVIVAATAEPGSHPSRPFACSPAWPRTPRSLRASRGLQPGRRQTC